MFYIFWKKLGSIFSEKGKYIFASLTEKRDIFQKGTNDSPSENVFLNNILEHSVSGW